MLLDDSGGVVEVPGPTGATQALRIGQATLVLGASVPIPKGVIRSQHQVVANFQAGLPLSAGHTDQWQMKIGGETRDDWVAEFFVPGPPPQPVIG